MYGKFKYDTIPLEKIFLDVQNPRIVQLDAPKTHQEALAYLFEHEELLPFIKTVALEGKNKGAERPYVIPKDGNFIVIEGNTRIAAYRVLCGLDPVPSEYQSEIPAISEEQKTTPQTVDCTVAPDRDRLLQIMARSHFGRGDKARWGYLGSRKAVHDEYLKGASLVHLAKSFDRTKGQIISLILEYKLYLEALTLGWTTQEKQLLLDPRLEFNPPVRFLETQGHKKLTGVDYDRVHIAIKFENDEAKHKFKHLVRKLVIEYSNGLSATSSFAEVFEDYIPPALGQPKEEEPKQESGSGGSKKLGGSTSAVIAGGEVPQATKPPVGPKKEALFSYTVTKNSLLLKQLMREANDINAKRFPAAATFILRNLVESLLKEIILNNGLNKKGKLLMLADALSLVIGSKGVVDKEDLKILKDFNNQHLSYLNLGAHGNVVPNLDRLMSARDSIDIFVKKHI